MVTIRWCRHLEPCKGLLSWGNWWIIINNSFQFCLRRVDQRRSLIMWLLHSMEDLIQQCVKFKMEEIFWKWIRSVESIRNSKRLQLKLLRLGQVNRKIDLLVPSRLKKLNLRKLGLPCKADRPGIWRSHIKFALNYINQCPKLFVQQPQILNS